jgi:hypothetical protein
MEHFLHWHEFLLAKVAAAARLDCSSEGRFCTDDALRRLRWSATAPTPWFTPHSWSWGISARPHRDVVSDYRRNKVNNSSRLKSFRTAGVCWLRIISPGRTGYATRLKMTSGLKPIYSLWVNLGKVYLGTNILTIFLSSPRNGTEIWVCGDNNKRCYI